MTAWTQPNPPEQARPQRRGPGSGRCVHVAFDSENERLGPEDGEPPRELHIAATNAQGNLPVWLDDCFWLDVMKRWSSESIVVHIDATPGAMLHEVIFHQLCMLRRVAPKWRLVGHCHLSDLNGDEAVTMTALSPYHEVRVIDAMRSGVSGARAIRVEDAMARVRQVQRANKRTTPIIKRYQPAIDKSAKEPVEQVRPATRKRAARAG